MASMRRAGIILLSALGIGLAACGKTQEPPAYDVQILAENPTAAPIAPPASDEGILQDPAQYRPAAVSAGAAAPSADRAKAAAEAPEPQDPAAAVRELISDLLDDMESGEIELVLGAFVPEQIQPLLDDNDFLFDTAEAYDALSEALAEVAGDAASERLAADLRKLVTDALKIEVVDATTVTVTPDPLRVVLGPALAPETLTVKLVEDEWRIHLEKTLTESDVGEIAAFHEKLRDTLYELADRLADKDIKGREEVYTALLAAVAEGDQKKAGEDEDFIEIDGQKIPKRPVVPKP